MCARARVYVGVYMCVVEVHVCGYDKFTPRGLPISKTMIFIDKEKWNAGPNSAPTNESEKFSVPRPIYQDWFFFTFSQSFKKSDLLENELPDVQSKVILQVCGAFACFAWQNVLNWAVTASARLKSLLQLASFLLENTSTLSPSASLSLSIPLPHRLLSEAADHLKKKGEGTWIKTEGTSLRYVSWCSSDL